MTLRDRLRALPVFDVDLPAPASLLADPETQFLRWLDEAVAAGEPEPHAMTVSTWDGALPDVRVLILKDLDSAGWWFASESTSAKGLQLAAHPVAALCFHWKFLGRQVRVRGHVSQGTAAQAEADYLARGLGADVPSDWAVWCLRASHVELWQASEDRQHHRALYRRAGTDWARVDPPAAR